MTENTEPEYSLYEVVCESADCENNGYVLQVIANSTDPIVICGPCGIRIESVSLIEESVVL